jgi:hypothetical protein
MRIYIGFIVVVCIFMTGCLSTVRIKRDPLKPSELDEMKNETDVQGIPFYTKTAMCKQQTTWLQPFYTLTLKTTTKTAFVNEEAANKESEATKKPRPNLPEPTVITKNKVLAFSDYTKDPSVLKLRTCLAKTGNLTQCDVEQLWNEIAKLLTYVPLEVTEEDLVKPELGFAVKVANSSSPELCVDYSRVYYYNSAQPWIGSSQLSAKLAADGTLSEGSAQITSQTLSTFLPVSAVLSAITKSSVKAAEEAYAMERKVQYELTIKEDAYKHTHSKYVSFSTPCAVDPKGVMTEYALTITLSGEKEEKKDEGNTVKVSGSVVLPKKPDEKK